MNIEEREREEAPENAEETPAVVDETAMDAEPLSAEEPAASLAEEEPKAVEAPGAPPRSQEAAAPAEQARERPEGRRPERGERERRPRGFRRRKVCAFCVEKIDAIDYKDAAKLRRYLSDRARIEPRRKTGTCAKHQRWLSVALKRARHLALLPYTPEHIRVSGVTTRR